MFCLSLHSKLTDMNTIEKDGVTYYCKEMKCLYPKCLTDKE
jgi:hypothetical protein